MRIRFQLPALLLLGPALAASPALAAKLALHGGRRVLTVSGEPLLAYHLVERGATLTAEAEGPLVVQLRLRRHSRGRQRGQTEAALDVDGGETDRFQLPASPAGRYLAVFGFAPGPEASRTLKLGPGHHVIAVRALGGAIVVALNAKRRPAHEPEVAPLVAEKRPASEGGLTAAPLVAPRPAPKPVPAVASSAPVSAPAPSVATPFVSATPSIAERVASSAPSSSEGRLLIGLRAGSASQPQTAATGGSLGLDVRYFLAPHFSLGVAADVFGWSLASAAGSLSTGLSVLAIPILLEGVVDLPIYRTLSLSLGAGVGGSYGRFDRSLAAGATHFPVASSSGIAPAGTLLAGLSVAALAGRLGVDARITSTLPQDLPGVAHGLLIGATLAEVSYAFLF